MDEKTKLGLGMSGMALIMGVLGDALLRAIPWGFNVFLWTGILVAAVLLLIHWRPVALRGGGRWLLLPAILFAAAFAWRDSLPLKLLDALALVVALSLAAWLGRKERIHLAGIAEYALGITMTGFSALLGFFLLVIGDIQWKGISGERESPHDRWPPHAMALGRGLVIACPMLLLFTGLFMAADAVFENIVKNIFHIDFANLFTHIFLTAFCTWVIGGYLRGMLLGHDITIMESRRPVSLSLGIVEIGTVLGLLNIIFLGFVVVQFRYFFDGAEMIEATTGLTYSEYARRGFFELVTVAALVLPLLLLAHWLLPKENFRNQLIFRALAWAQVLMLFVIMASAVQRMRLYQSEYGLTQLRLYATAFMGWLGVVFVWFAATVLRGQRDRFAFGALVAGFLMIAVLHSLNPDALIIRANVAHAKAGHRFDAMYAISLGADAVPPLVVALPALDQQDRCVIAARILERWSLPGEGGIRTEGSDWRTWSWARREAWRIVQENGAILKEMACSQKRE